MLSILTLILSLFVCHDYHMGKTEISVNIEDKRIEITQFLFIDDLEKALETKGNPFQNLGTKKELATADSLIFLYLDHNIKISKGKQYPKALNFVGKEISEDLSGMFIYLTQEIDIKSKNPYTVTNTLFTELFDDQVNLVYFEHHTGEKDYFVLDSNQNSKILD